MTALAIKLGLSGVGDYWDDADRYLRNQFAWEGRYAHVGDVKPGDKVAVTFPIEERTVKEKMWGLDYTMIIKGNSVVFIDPPGKCYLSIRATIIGRTRCDG